MTNQTLKEKTTRGLLWGGLGNAVQQLFNLFFGIFLARILNPTDYGMVGMLAIFSAIAGIIQDGGFAVSLINKKDAKHEDYNAVFWFNLLTGIVVYIILFLCAPLIARFFHTPALTPLARFVFLGFLIGCTGTVHGAIFTKKLMIKEKAKINMIALLISGIVGVLMAYNGMSYWGIASQSITYMFIMVCMIWYKSPWRPTLNINLKPLKEMLPFSIKLFFTNIFNQVNLNIFSALLGKFYTVSQVGYYTQGNKWMTMGSTFVGSMLNSVSQPVLAEVSSEKERQQRVFRKMLRFTSFVSFPIMLGLALVAKELIIITITEKWLPSVFILQLLCVWGAVVPISSLYSNMIISRGKSNIYMWNTICLGISQLFALFITSRHGIYIMIISFVIINSLWIAIWNYFARRNIGLRFIDAAKDIFPYAIAAGVTMFITYWMTRNISDIYILFSAKILIFVTLYFLFMWISNSIIFKESIAFILKKKKDGIK